MIVGNFPVIMTLLRFANISNKLFIRLAKGYNQKYILEIFQISYIGTLYFGLHYDSNLSRKFIL